MNALDNATTEQLQRWWCILNVFEWPDDLPLPKPTSLTFDSPEMKAAWRAVNERIPNETALVYWNQVFLPNRNGRKPPKINPPTP